MNYATCLKDFTRLREIAKGYPHDFGEILENVAETLLSCPTKAKARNCLTNLINEYYQRGDSEGHSLTGHPGAREIFRRHGLID